MTIWLIQPRDPIIVRDGRPFGPFGGARARSLQFPLPSTTTGALRTQEGSTGGQFDTSLIQEVLKLEVKGPFLVQAHDDGSVDWYAPTPADALLLRPKDGEVPDAQPALEAKKIKALCKQLRPLALPSGAQSDLINLALVGQSPWAPDKPMSGPPRFWKWSVFEEWLTSPKDEVSRLVTEFGIPGPLGEQRTHVAINPDSGAALDTALFQTKGLEFSLQGGAPLALALISAPAKMSPRITGFGGERRLVAWKKVATGEPPACPSEVIEQVGELGACRIVLLTPAAFTTGNLPTRLLEERDSVQPKLIAMALSRYQTVSGWDMAASNGPGKPLGKPKPTRRLVPAGTVLWLNLEGSVQARREWVKNLWFQCISDTDDDRRSGFGVVVAGVWDGKLAELVVPLPESTQHLYGGNAL